MHGVYVGVKPSEESKRKLQMLLIGLKVSNPVQLDAIHLTLVFSRHYDNVVIEEINNYKAKIKELKILLSREGKRCLVAELNVTAN
ncbi:MAG: hypothetical protein OQL19_05870 [Gammaproteobacteria bacterium]|nr:hypothetical protein [Gammaproteobacteria bacterium]